MNLPPPPIRRIVTGIDDQGRSIFLEDGPSPAQSLIAERPGYRMTNLWRTVGGGAAGAPDGITEMSGVMPPPGGTVIRIIEWPTEPTDPVERQRLMDITFAGSFPDAHRAVREGEHPGMHTTQTVDYAIVLDGEVFAIVDQEERLMKPGDVLIQRGTRHAWANRSGKSAKIVFILVDAAA